MTVLIESLEFAWAGTRRLLGRRQRVPLLQRDPVAETTTSAGLLAKVRGTLYAVETDWLRWLGDDGSALEMPIERANAETARANAEAERADRLAAELAGFKARRESTQLPSRRGRAELRPYLRARHGCRCCSSGLHNPRERSRFAPSIAPEDFSVIPNP
jgi:hypothetical protein